MAKKKLPQPKTLTRIGNSEFISNPALGLDVLNEIKLQMFELFGKETWIPRGGISRKGNIYITVIVKNDQDLDIWYSKRKGIEPRS